jgi:hypothetical protein
MRDLRAWESLDEDGRLQGLGFYGGLTRLDEFAPEQGSRTLSSDFRGVPGLEFKTLGAAVWSGTTLILLKGLILGLRRLYWR